MLGNLHDKLEATHNQTEDVEDEEEMEIEVDAIPTLMLMDVGTELCGVPPEEISLATLNEDPKKFGVQDWLLCS